ncbi:hypothetical protein O0L34_g7689 [Tuta absoluta]|nr:hypothetical protein O0L34_g7689 [Tuta absoluta]
MASRVSIAFVLLVLYVAASIQMPDQGPRSRIKRQDEDDDDESESAEETASTDGAEETEEGEASASGGGFSGGIGGGGGSGTGTSGVGGGGPFPQFNQGREVFAGIVNSFASGKPPSPEFWRKAIPFMNFFFTDSDKPK